MQTARTTSKQRRKVPLTEVGYSNSVGFLVVTAALGLSLLLSACGATTGAQTGAASTPTSTTTTAGAPPKPSGTVTTAVVTPEVWSVAQSLPTNITHLTFSVRDPLKGYAAAFINKQMQVIYTTNDTGTSWQKGGTLQAPFCDYLSSNPMNLQDIVLLSGTVPAPGTFTVNRSVDGGQTWQQQSVSMTSTATVTQIGWSDSTFYVGFQLDGQLLGSSGLAAFPLGQASYHLDVDGKINEVAIAHLTLITGYQNKLQVWGTDDSSTHTIGFTTINQGKTWQIATGTSLTPVTATADGTTIIAESNDGTRFAKSSDGGATYVMQPAFTGPPSSHRGVFLAPHGTTFLVAGADGTYEIRNGVWVKVTSKEIANISDGIAGHSARLWTYDDHGQVIWLDD